MYSQNEFDELLKTLANQRYSPLLEWEADYAPVTVTSKSLIDMSEIPYDVWVYIFQKFNLTELVLTGRVSNSFQQLARQRILAYRLERSLFVHKSELNLEGFRVGPILSPLNGDLVIVFNPDGTPPDEIPQLEAYEISSQKLVSRCNLPPRIRDLSPSEIRISNTGAYFCVHYDVFVLLYAIHLDVPHSLDFGIRLIHVFRFGVPPGVPADQEPGQRTSMDSRVLSAFSSNDASICVCRIDRTGRDGRTVTLQYTSAVTRLCGDPPRYPYNYSTVSANMVWRVFNSHLPWADIKGIDINATPLRIIVPPDLYLKTGCVIRAERPNATGFIPIQTRGNRKQKLQFSRCGRFLVETNSDKHGGFFEIRLKWWDLVSGQLVHQFCSSEERKTLNILLSKNSERAILVLGRTGVYDSICVTGWNLYLLKSGETIRVDRKGHDMHQCYEPHFSISSDAELVAMVVEKSPIDTDYIVEIYEAATGIQVTSLMCKIHYDAADYYFDNWMSLPGLHGCTQLIGNADEVVLTTFTTCSRGVGLTHFKSASKK